MGQGGKRLPLGSPQELSGPWWGSPMPLSLTGQPTQKTPTHPSTGDPTVTSSVKPSPVLLQIPLFYVLIF